MFVYKDDLFYCDEFLLNCYCSNKTIKLTFNSLSALNLVQFLAQLDSSVKR